MKYSSKTILLLALVAVAGAADDAVTMAKIDSSLSLQGQHGDLRSPQQADPCQPEIDVLVGCLNTISTGQSCLDCIIAIEDDMFEQYEDSVPCSVVSSFMCPSWNSLCPCGSCGDEWEEYYLGCVTESACGAMACTEVDPCADLFQEANSCVTSSAPSSCGGCIETAINDLDFTHMPCTALETEICDITSKDCSCSPCEQDLQDYYFCSASDWCEDLGPCTMPSAEECTNLIADANSCESQFDDTSVCVPCMDFIYSSISSIDCDAKKDEFCEQISSETNFCNCHVPCYDAVALAVSCGTDCEGMTCATPDPFPSPEECEEALATVNECFAQCVF